ncbi:hypothetical protein ACIBG6_39260 [Streptomyces sp. NPDC050842]|uniref:hypothetical protein n=1 Tax=Streptomyces sp. NPDC050842 TaxID=3365636 RepID=UPI0037B9565B
MASTRRPRGLQGSLAFTASVAALTAAAGTAVAAGNPTAIASGQSDARDARGATAGEAVVQTPSFSMSAVHKRTMDLYLYFPDREGGFEPQYDAAINFEGVANALRVDNDKDGEADAVWYRHTNGLLTYSGSDGLNLHSKDIGRGWNTYTTVLSPGNLGGAKEADLIGVDKTGVLWSYLAYQDGRLTPRTRVGGGWGSTTRSPGRRT